MATNTVQDFTAFYDAWILRLHHLQHQLSTASAAIDNVKDQELIKLVDQASEHYRQYYEEKSNAIKKDVFLIMSSPWYTSFDQALFWVSEFPQSLVFRFVSNLDLTAEQGRRVEVVRVEIERKEAEIGEAMAMEAMRVVMVEADGLRVAEVVAVVLECLVVGQRVRFFGIRD